MDIVFIFLSIFVTQQNNARRGRERQRFKKKLNRLKNVAIEIDSDTIEIASHIVYIVLVPSTLLSD